MEETLSLAPFRHILGRLENGEDQEPKSWGLSGEIVLWPRGPNGQDKVGVLRRFGNRRQPILHHNNTSRARLPSRDSLLYRWIRVAPGETWNPTDTKLVIWGETYGPFQFLLRMGVTEEPTEVPHGHECQ